MIAVILMLAMGASPPPRNPENWANDKSEVADAAAVDFPGAFEETQAICRRLGDPVPLGSDGPTPETAKALGGCDPTSLYYGIGVRRDFVKARQCAILRQHRGPFEANDSPMILMQIYANGFGTSKNTNLATAFACEAGGAPAEIDMRVLHVAGLTSRGIDKGKPLDYCEDTTSGQTIGYCESREAQIKDSRRDIQMAGLITALPPRAQEAYRTMKIAFEAYNSESSVEESGNFGTSAAGDDADLAEGARKSFANEVKNFLAGRWSRSLNSREADVRLNGLYKQARVYVGQHPDDNVTADGVQSTQRLWLIFRDAFLRFAAAARPDFPRDAVLTHLTNLRAAELQSLTNPST